MIHPSDFFNFGDAATAELFRGCDYVWQALAQLDIHVERLLGDKRTILGKVMDGAYVSERAVYIGEGARIEPGAYVLGPAYIGQGVVVRHGAYIRENVIMMPGSVLGHAGEVKRSIFLPRAHAPHFNYVGDSIVGQRVNLGAGTRLSNLTLTSVKDPVSGKRPTIELEIGGEIYDTGLSKLGAILGDDAQTGCNAVLNPGCLVGPNTLIYANLSLRKGLYPANSVVKLRQTIEIAERR
jgi:NDP-sugar pyrophosphorylase family protein